ncbi:MAG: O-methyltransferase, partial [Mesorhizobium sp.]
MSEQNWHQVDDYFEGALIGEDRTLGAMLAANRAAGLPAIDVSPLQGKFLALLVKMTGAKRVLEIGTLGGYSTVWMAGAVSEGGKVVTLEFDPHHAAVARSNFVSAGIADKVELIEGRAIQSLDDMIATGAAPFDLVFIDADKPSNPAYLERAMKLARSGTVIVLDNVVRNGAVADAASDDPNVIGSRCGIEMLGRD